MLKKLGLEEFDPLRDLCVVFIGSTHDAQISIRFAAMDSANNRVLVNCGVWLGSCRFDSGMAVPACQVGVLCEGVVRFFQLGLG